MLAAVNAFCQEKTNVVSGETAHITFDKITIYSPGNKTTKLCEAAGITPNPCAHYWVNIAIDVPANTQVYFSNCTYNCSHDSNFHSVTGRGKRDT